MTAVLMGLDVGTTGCKSVVFDASGTMLGSAYREYPVLCREPLQAEQDGALVRSLLLETMAQAVTEAGVSAVDAVSLSVQGDALLAVDESFAPLCPAILGMDYRPQAVCRALADRLDPWDLYLRTGQPLHPINFCSKLLFLREYRPEVYKKARHFVTYAEFIMAGLGGRAAVDHTMASRSMGYDLASGGWAGDLLDLMGIDGGRLSEICPSGTALGTMDAALARSLGLRNCPLLIAGGHDQTVGAIGAGAVHPGMAVDSAGTAEVLSVVYDRPQLNRTMFESFYACYHHAVPGLYFSFAHMQVGGILQRWYRDNLGAAEVEEARRSGRDFYTLAQSKCPAGPASVLVLPHFNGSGTPVCDVESMGAFVGMTLSTTRHDLLKGILDSLAFELRINLDVMAGAGISIDRLRAVGGGARSPLWLQTKADVLGRPITTLRCKEAGCLGAAVLAAVGMGLYGSMPEAVQAMVQVERTYTPEPEAAAQYAARYAVYRQLYRQLRPIHHQLAALRRSEKSS